MGFFAPLVTVTSAVSAQVHACRDAARTRTDHRDLLSVRSGTGFKLSMYFCAF